MHVFFKKCNILYLFTFLCLTDYMLFSNAYVSYIHVAKWYFVVGSWVSPNVLLYFVNVVYYLMFPFLPFVPYQL